MITALDIAYGPVRVGTGTEIMTEPSEAMRDIPDAVTRWFLKRFSWSAFDRIQRMHDDSMLRQTIWEHEGFRFTWEWSPGTRVVSFCLLSAPVNRTGYVYAKHDSGYGRDLYVRSLTGDVRFFQHALIFASKDDVNAYWREQKNVPFDGAHTLPDAKDWLGLRIVEVPVAADELLHHMIPVDILMDRMKKTESNIE